MSIKKKEDIAEALRQDNIELQTSGRIMAENLEILRGKLEKIHLFTTELLASLDEEHKTYLTSDLNMIIDLSKDGSA